MGAKNTDDINGDGNTREGEGIKRKTPAGGEGEIKKARTRATSTRSKKSAGNSKGTQTPPNTVKVETVTSEIKPPASDYVAEVEADTLSIEASVIVIALLNGLANILFGPMAAMNEIERGLIEPPLGRLLKKYGITPERVSGYSDPVLILIGLGSWLSRVNRERAEVVKETPARGDQEREGAAEGDELGIVGDDVFASMAAGSDIFEVIQSNVS